MFCSECGTQIADGVKFCSNCGAPVAIAPTQAAAMTPMEAGPIASQQQASTEAPSGGLCCPNCGSNNVMVQMVEQGQQTTKKGLGFGGHMNNAARGATAVMTLGMSNLVWKKSKGTNKTKTVNATVAICQNCGNSWEIKKGIFGSAPGSIFR